MGVTTKITYNMDGLGKFKKEIAGTYRARVGIIGSKAQQDHVLEQHGYKNVARTTFGQITNVEIGVIQMFGSHTKNIPPRDFLLMPIQKNHKKIMAQMQSAAVRSAMYRGDYKAVFSLLGAIAEGFVHQAFETGGFGMWPPLKHRDGKPLWDTGQLNRSVSSDVVMKGRTI